MVLPRSSIRPGSDQARRRAGPRPAIAANPSNDSAAASEEAAAAALTLQFLSFISAGRTYEETMEAWRSHCPRMPIWENAVRDGLVRIESNGAMKSSRIVLTAKGAAHRLTLCWQSHPTQLQNPPLPA